MSEKQTMGVLEGVLVYAKIAEADKKYKSDDTEYSIGVIVADEDVADEWDERFAKQPAKKIKVSQFEEKFKFEVPEEFKGEKNVYLITLKRAAVVNGEEKYPQYRPRVFLETEDERVDITESRLIANGSRGKVSYRISENPQYGDIARLNNVLIPEETFIEYVPTAKAAGDEFGDAKKPVKKEAARKEATEARKSKKEAEEKAEQSSDEFGDKKPVKEVKKAPKKEVVKEEPEEDDDAPY